jgi:hypothetical protein
MVRAAGREQQAPVSILASAYRRWRCQPHEILLSLYGMDFVPDDCFCILWLKFVQQLPQAVIAQTPHLSTS